MSQPPTVALLFGGRSGEHEVSLRSAVSVAAGLAARHDVLCVLIDKQGNWLLQDSPQPRPAGGEPVFLAPLPGDGGRLRRLEDAGEAARPDVYFPVLHGTYGEDGTVQGLFELAGVPYAGAGVAASAAAMDKAMMKALFERAGLEQVPHRVLLRRDAQAEAATARRARAAAVRQAREPGLERRHQQGEDSGRARPGARARVPLRPQAGRRARARGARDRARGARQRPAAGVCARRGRARPRVLRLRVEVRGEVPHRPADPGAARRRGHERGTAPRDRGLPGRGRAPVTPASTSSSRRAAAGCWSTRSTPSPASRRSACTRSSGRRAGSRTKSCSSDRRARPRAPSAALATLDRLPRLAVRIGGATAPCGGLRAAWCTRNHIRSVSSCPRPHIFVSPAGSPCRPSASGAWRAETGSWSRFARFPHARAQPKLLQLWSIAGAVAKNPLTRG